MNIEILFFDYIVLIITLVFIIFNFWKGFINSILGLLTWVGSIFITIFSYEYLSSYLNNLILNISFLSNFKQFSYILSVTIAIPLIFLLSLFFLKRIRKILSSDLDKQILGLIIDKIFGVIYGIIFSYIVFSSLLYFSNNNEISILININIFLTENSNILNEISVFNEKIINNYFYNNLNN